MMPIMWYNRQRNNVRNERKNKMNKNQLANEVAAKANLKKKDAEAAVSAVFDCITEALANDDKVQVVGFGTFKVKHREAHAGRNPATGENITISASNSPVFTAGKSLKEKVN